MQQLTPWIQSRFYYKNSTLPLSMGFLTFYYTGATKKAPTFQEKNGALNPNPVPLDIVGEAQIWLSESIVYDVEIRDANNALQDTRRGVSASSEGGGGGGLDFVTAANSETITLDGLGTQPNPLTATLNISSVTSNALGITTAGGGGVYVADLSEAIANKLDKVDATAQSVESEVEFKNGVEVSGALANGSAITMPDNSWIRPSTNQGAFYLTNGIDPTSLNSTIHFLNSGLSLFSGNGVNQFGSMIMGNAQLYLRHSVANVAKDSLMLGNEGLSLQTTTGRGLYVTSTNLELSNTTSNISFNTSGLRFNGFNGGYEFINVPTDTLAYTYGENASGDLVKGTGGGGGSQDLQSVTDLGDTTTNGATFGDTVITKDINIQRSTLNESYEFSERGITLGFPVATTRPTQVNKTIAFDIMPNGSPSDFGDNGVSWLDIVDTDVKDDVVTAFNTLRMGIGGTKADFGVLAYNGATPKPLNFVYGDASDYFSAGNIGVDGSLNWLKDSFFKDNLTLESATFPTFNLKSDIATGVFQTFSSTLTYDGGLFQNTSRWLNNEGSLVLNSFADDILFITGGSLISSDVALRINASKNALFSGRILQGSVTDDGTTGGQFDSIRTDGGATFGGAVNIGGSNSFAEINMRRSSDISRLWHFGVSSSGAFDFVESGVASRFKMSQGGAMTLNGTPTFTGLSKFNNRILQGSVTDDGTTGVQGEDFRADGSLGSIVIGQSPSSSSKTGNSIKYTRDGANYLTYGLGGLSGSLRIGSTSSLTNVLFTSDLNSKFYGDVVLDAIPTGTQVGLVGYDSNGKLIQGVGGGGGVTPTAWVNASLNSSLGVRSSMRPLRYRGDGIDGVQIEGSCRYNTGLALFPGFTVVLFTLPSGSRPNKDINLTVQVGFNGAVPQIEAWASLNSSNGQVTLKNSDSVAISQLYDITINTRFSLI